MKLLLNHQPSLLGEIEYQLVGDRAGGLIHSQSGRVLAAVVFHIYAVVNHKAVEIPHLQFVVMNLLSQERAHNGHEYRYKYYKLLFHRLIL